MRNLNKLFIIAGFIILSAPAFAQEATAVAPAPKFVLDVNTVLAIVAFFLFLIIVSLGLTLKSAIELYKEKNNMLPEAKEGNTGMKVLSLLIPFLFLTGISAFAQNATPEAAAASTNSGAVFSDGNLLRYLLWFIVAIEFIAILVFVKWIKFFTGIEAMRLAKRKKEGVAQGFTFEKFWQKFNKFKPIEQEASLDVGHSYDGIRELDNATPPWFTIAFIATIIFGLGYLYRYHVAHGAPNQYEEYENSVTQAKMEVEAYLKKSGSAIDENTVTMRDAAGIADGAKLYTANCAVCHGDKGQGSVGPNLTDEEWLHGCSIQDVFKSIKYGWVANGMKSWKDDFSGAQIADLASYIETLKGTKPAGAKAPQGTPCKDNGAAAPAAGDSTAAVATPAAATDSAATK